MTTRDVATVFGGSGFVGRYVVKRLAADGYVVRVPGRDPESAAFLKPMGSVGQIVPLFASLSDPATIARGVAGARLVVNLMGILAETRAGDFERIHAQGAALVAREASAAGVSNLVHVSAIGAAPDSPSAYGRSKGHGEAAVAGAFPGATILRPSIVFGAEDKFFNRFAAMAQFAPVMPVICGDTRFQPVYVGNVADAVHAALMSDAASGVYELGGPQIISFRDLIRMILRMTDRQRPLLNIPYAIARIQAQVAEHLPGKPFTTDQLLMLRSDNVVAPGARGLEALGGAPTPIDLIVPAYLARYRAGGAKRSESDTA